MQLKCSERRGGKAKLICTFTSWRDAARTFYVNQCNPQDPVPAEPHCCRKRLLPRYRPMANRTSLFPAPMASLFAALFSEVLGHRRLVFDLCRSRRLNSCCLDRPPENEVHRGLDQYQSKTKLLKPRHLATAIVAFLSTEFVHWDRIELLRTLIGSLSSQMLFSSTFHLQYYTTRSLSRGDRFRSDWSRRPVRGPKSGCEGGQYLW